MPSDAKRLGNTRYRHSPKGRINRLARNAAYRVTEKGKAAAARRSARYFAHPERRFKMYQKNARHRGIEFTLTFEAFMLLWGKPCSYCGTDIKTIGLDRVDNTRGYFLVNVVPACTRCNRMKYDMPRGFFVEHCRKIIAHVEMLAWAKE